jgi:hypothetical protein
MNNNPEPLPRHWERPHQHDYLQRTLFSRPTLEALAEMKVSPDDLLRWHSMGWISFNLKETDVIEQPQEDEVRFVRNLARSGLSDAQINHLLQELPKPYSFYGEPAFHFEYGWIVPSVPSREDPFDVVSENVDDWLEDLANDGKTARLEELASKINELLDQGETADEE